MSNLLLFGSHLSIHLGFYYSNISKCILYDSSCFLVPTNILIDTKIMIHCAIVIEIWPNYDFLSDIVVAILAAILAAILNSIVATCHSAFLMGLAVSFPPKTYP